MLTVMPSFYDDFHCKAGACTDSCCIGWEIDIDDETAGRYRQVPGKFGEVLRENITVSEEGVPCFRLTADERCAFLQRDGLCRIYRELGKDSLCEICREHPRFYSFLADRTECGLGLCCEEACALLLNKEPMALVTEDDGVPCGTDDDEQFLLSVREMLFGILADRNTPLRERIRQLLQTAECAQKQHFPDLQTEAFPFDGQTLFDFTVRTFRETEPIDDAWTDYINRLAGEKDQILQTAALSSDETVYEKLLGYLLYRYFVEHSLEIPMTRVLHFCLVNLAFLLLCDGKTIREKNGISLSDRIDNIKRWSKQTEYSEENIEFLYRAIADKKNQNDIKKHD